jgi:hypothetical protein
MWSRRVFLGWTLDAFDLFLLVFVLKDIAQEFNTQITSVTLRPWLRQRFRAGCYLSVTGRRTRDRT